MAHECEIHTDKNGELIEFRVVSVSEQGLRVEVQHRRYGRIGSATISKLSESGWRMDDIRIDDHVPVRTWYQFYIGRVRFGGKPKMISYRNRGIGTALMGFLKRCALQHGVKQIEGVVPHQDNESRSHLVDWYSQQGFKLSMRTAEVGKPPGTNLVWRPSG